MHLLSQGLLFCKKTAPDFALEDDSRQGRLQRWWRTVINDFLGAEQINFHLWTASVGGFFHSVVGQRNRSMPRPSDVQIFIGAFDELFEFFILLATSSLSFRNLRR
jgi:hypothetical protein